MNHNASRFTLLFSMDFDSAGLSTGASVQVCVSNLLLIFMFNYRQWVDLLTLAAIKVQCTGTTLNSFVFWLTKLKVL